MCSGTGSHRIVKTPWRARPLCSERRIPKKNKNVFSDIAAYLEFKSLSFGFSINYFIIVLICFSIQNFINVSCMIFHWNTAITILKMTDDCRPPPWVFKIWNFWHSIVITVGFCVFVQISWKSDNPLTSYGQKQCFPIWHLHVSAILYVESWMLFIFLTHEHLIQGRFR